MSTVRTNGRFLRKTDGHIYGWTAQLAKRDDMIECDQNGNNLLPPVGLAPALEPSPGIDNSQQSENPEPDPHYKRYKMLPGPRLKVFIDNHHAEIETWPEASKQNLKKRFEKYFPNEV